ncbi:hypothetical protein [Nocardia sp. NPDC051570]|uniref:hypothetical protein n=1 Tax=Nocardia sp. NPDC051570 TaxID=3364324 RepID=UPI00378D2D3E
MFKILVFHETCGRRMQGNWNHGTPHYRCLYPSEYATADDIDHPVTVYVREDRLIGPIDSWPADIFHPDRIEHTLSTLEAAQHDHAPALDSARRSLAEYDRKLARHRAALEAGADRSSGCEVNLRSNCQVVTVAADNFWVRWWTDCRGTTG